MTSRIFTLLFSCVLASLSAASAQMQCSVPNCTTAGAEAACVTSVGNAASPTTCRDWASTDEGRTQCKIECSGSCFFVPLSGSDGATYCRLCDLYIRACETRFEVTGPVQTSIPTPHANPPVMRTTTRQVKPVLQCSMQACSFFGAESACLFKQTGQPDQEMTCADYAATSQSEQQCQFTCPQTCDANGPYDNERTQYCSLCHLQLASCERGYEIYGPYLVPGIEECSEEYCSAHGDDAECLPSRFHTVLITCAEWKNGN